MGGIMRQNPQLHGAVTSGHVTSLIYRWQPPQQHAACLRRSSISHLYFGGGSVHSYCQDNDIGKIFDRLYIALEIKRLKWRPNICFNNGDEILPCVAARTSRAISVESPSW